MARGAKLEAEVAAACAEHELSRREVFRFLAETRERRRWRLEDAPLFGVDEPDWNLPEGFEISGDGRIVPKSD